MQTLKQKITMDKLRLFWVKLKLYLIILYYFILFNIYIASREGNIDMVKFLLGSGASIEAEDNDGITSLFQGFLSKKLKLREFGFFFS